MKISSVVILILLAIICCSSPSIAQTDLLQSGPMVGYSNMKEVLLWVQTKNEASIYFEYMEKDNPKSKYKTATVRTEKQNAYVAKIIADQVLPGKEYTYQLFINKKLVERPYPLEFKTQPLFQYRTDAPDFSFAFGSCNYINDSLYDRPGKPYGDGYEIFESIHQKHPDLMIWGGDNIYLREADWGTQTGILYRNTHTRSVKELQPLLGSTHHYAIWDDHDYGPNDSDRSFWNKDISTNAFKLFWGNPNYGIQNEGGVTGTFTWNDVQFFLLDNRTFRSPNKSITGDRVYLGKKQMDWLIDGLVSSQASFKIIVCGGQVLNPAEVYENYATYPEERKYLLQTIKDEKIKDVFFLSGDRHHSELSKMERNETYPLYDLTVSPLTSGTHAPMEKENSSLVEGTLVTERNFGIIKVAGKKHERKLIITLYNQKGNEIWTKEISAENLK